ncbi:hypothetical protein ABC347_09640 [Sphingomonas sp. 1P06PA]|uniref:hypothetical protein n=1 Tax=Sphingomonas sp. 1P06PA TaxID=554121 RepID=UPI0039A4B342
MNRFRLVLAIATAMALPLPAAAQAGNAFSQRLQQLPDLQRRAVLRRAVLDSGQRCKRVDAGALKGRYKNLVMWTATCNPGGAYGIFIGPDGSVQVRPCADMRTLKLPAC